MTLGLAAGQVCLFDAHDVWANLYQLEKARILNVIGTHILDIQHVGSTSISGVPAKPILDILIGVESFEEAAVCIGTMECIGYRYRGENGIPRRHYFVKGDPRTHHVHMVERDGKDWRITVLFRDFLRSHPDVAHEYAAAKKHLAMEHAHNRDAYQQGKDKVVEHILERASGSP